MAETRILAQTQIGQQITTAYQIENRVFITESHFNPNGVELGDLLVPIIASQQKETKSAALRTHELTEN